MSKVYDLVGQPSYIIVSVIGALGFYYWMLMHLPIFGQI